MLATNVAHPRYRSLLLLINQHPRMARLILDLSPTDRRVLISTTTVDPAIFSRAKPSAKPSTKPKALLPATTRASEKVSKPAKKPLRWHHFASTSKEVYNIVRTMGEIDTEGVATLAGRSYNHTNRILMSLTKKGLLTKKAEDNRKHLYSIVEGVEVVEGVVPKSLPNFKNMLGTGKPTSVPVVTESPRKPVDVLQYVKNGDITPADFRKKILADNPGMDQDSVNAAVGQAMANGDLEIHGDKIAVGSAKVTRDILAYLSKSPAKVKDIVSALGYRPVATQLGLQTLSLQGKITVKNGTAALKLPVGGSLTEARVKALRGF